MSKTKIVYQKNGNDERYAGSRRIFVINNF